jgi:hypothetical protein
LRQAEQAFSRYKAFSSRLSERRSSYDYARDDPTKRTEWGLSQLYEANNGLPHIVCTAYHEINQVTGPIRSEIMTLTGVMGRMQRKKSPNHNIIPVSVLYPSNKGKG